MVESTINISENHDDYLTRNLVAIRTSAAWRLTCLIRTRRFIASFKRIRRCPTGAVLKTAAFATRKHALSFLYFGLPVSASTPRSMTYWIMVNATIST
jgi:hypothetical protein